MDTQEETLVPLVAPLVFRLVYSRLDPRDKLRQRRVVAISKEIREVVLRDINVLWKNRFEEISGVRFNDYVVLDWCLACKLAMESLESLRLLNNTQINDVFAERWKHAMPMLMPAGNWLCHAAQLGRINTAKELTKIPDVTLLDANRAIIHAVTSEQTEVLSYLLDAVEEIYPGLVAASVPYPKPLKIVLACTRIEVNDRPQLIITAINGRYLSSLNILLRDPRQKFKSYHSDAMFNALVRDNNYIVKILLKDPKGRGIKRDYRSSILHLTDKIAKMILTYPDVELNDKTITAINKKFGVANAQKWMKKRW